MTTRQRAGLFVILLAILIVAGNGGVDNMTGPQLLRQVFYVLGGGAMLLWPFAREKAADDAGQGAQKRALRRDILRRLIDYIRLEPDRVEGLVTGLAARLASRMSLPELQQWQEQLGGGEVR